MSLPTSDEDLVLLHNPRCSKSRATKELLEEKGAKFSVRLYLEEPLSRAELEDLAGRLGRPIGEWTRRKDDAYAEAGLDAQSSDDALLAAVERLPALMERPILVQGKRAVVGRPPENVLPLL